MGTILASICPKNGDESKLISTHRGNHHPFTSHDWMGTTSHDQAHGLEVRLRRGSHVGIGGPVDVLIFSLALQAEMLWMVAKSCTMKRKVETC